MVMAVADAERVEDFRRDVVFAGAAPADRPAVAGRRLTLDDFGLEPHALVDSERVCIVLEILGEDPVRRIVGSILRQREILIRRGVFRADDVGGLEHARMPGRVVEAPVAADALAAIEADDVKAEIGKILDGRNTGGAGADHGDALGSHGVPPPKVFP